MISENSYEKFLSNCSINNSPNPRADLQNLILLHLRIKSQGTGSEVFYLLCPTWFKRNLFSPIHKGEKTPKTHAN